MEAARLLRNNDILPHRYTVSQPEGVSSTDLRNFGVLHHYTASLHKIPRHGT